MTLVNLFYGWWKGHFQSHIHTIEYSTCMPKTFSYFLITHFLKITIQNSFFQQIMIVIQALIPSKETSSCKDKISSDSNNQLIRVWITHFQSWISKLNSLSYLLSTNKMNKKKFRLFFFSLDSFHIDLLKQERLREKTR